MSELKLPELGEGIDKVDVSAVLVAVGDLVRRDQPVIEVETEKASLEVPADADGKIVELRVAAGDKVNVGQTILIIEGDAAAADDGDAIEAEALEPVVQEEVAPAKEKAPEVAPAPAVSRLAVPAVTGSATESAARPLPGRAAPAAPSSRALARELGVDIMLVPGTGPGARISRDDVKAYAKAVITGGGQPGGVAVTPPLPDFSQWGEVERQPLTNVRRATARIMATAWATVPSVTQFDQADITQLESMRKQFNQQPAAADRKLTMTAIVVKMLASVLKQFPSFNASLDLAGDVLIQKNYIHIGVAVDTERGLLVPVIRDVDKKNLIQTTVALNDLAERARNKKVKPDEMQGSTFTVTNLGGLGTTHFSPIVNWPEVAILGVGRAAQQAVMQDGSFQARLMMPLSLSYDHRVIDGANAARFLRRLAEALEQPLLLLLDD